MSLDKNIFPTPEDVPKAYDMPRMDQNHYLINGEKREWKGSMQDVFSPVMIRDAAGNLTQKVLGSYPLMDAPSANAALDAAVNAYAKGCTGNYWPDFPVEQRIEHMETFIKKMSETRTPVVNYLMLEIGKSYTDACKEFDRTVQYIKDTVDELRYMNRKSTWMKEEGIHAKKGRASLGTTLVMGPYNYPLNETFTTLIPALLMGNTAVMKPAKYGVLLHEPLLNAYKESFPAGVINTVYGDGASIIQPMMKSGKVDVLAFIGGANTVNKYILPFHPNPAHLEAILGLNAKNPGIVLKHSDRKTAVKEGTAGSLSFNGQRCTALKMFFVHESIAEEFAADLASSIDNLVWGMPWTTGANITPLPDLGMVKNMESYVTDALSKGAKLVNPKGGQSVGTFFAPAVLFGVKPNMRIYNEEQFGPVVPIVTFSDITEPIKYMIDSDFGQQASIFGNNPAEVGKLVDVAFKQVCRTNLNGQCMRGPDKYPFTGRKSSAKKVLSIRDALEAFSLPSLFAAPDNEENRKLIQEMIKGGHSKYLSAGCYPS